MKRVFLFAVIVCAYFVNALPLHAEEQSPPAIVVPIEPLRYVAEQLAGDTVDVVTLVPPGRTPEDYSVTPQELRRIATAERYFTLGLPSETALLRHLPKNKVIDLNAGIDLRPWSAQAADSHEGHDHHDHEHEPHAHHHEGHDPHTWTAPANLLQQAEVLKAVLIDIAPQTRAKIEQRFTQLSETLTELDQQLKSAFAKRKEKVLLVYHPAFGYLAASVDAKQVAVEENGRAPTPKHLRELAHELSPAARSIMLLAPAWDTPSARNAARVLGAKPVMVDPLAYDFPAELHQLLKALSPE